MIYAVNEDNLDVSKEAFFYAVLLYFNEQNDVYEELCSKGYLIYDYWENNKPINPRLTSEGITWVETVFSNYNNTEEKNSSIVELAKQMQELFPEGIYPSTKAITWRGSLEEIVSRLKIFMLKYGEYKNDTILQATKSYIKQFDIDKSYMMTLKNFILKPTDLSTTSTLLEFIQNKITINKYSNANLL